MSPRTVTTNEIMDFLREQMVTKEQFDRLEDEVFEIKNQLNTFATKDELHDLKVEILGVMDGFAKRQDIFEVELVAMRHRFDRFEDWSNSPRSAL